MTHGARFSQETPASEPTLLDSIRNFAAFFVHYHHWNGGYLQTQDGKTIFPATFAEFQKDRKWLKLTTLSSK